MIEVDPQSVESIDDAIVRLQAMRSLLIVEANPAQSGSVVVEANEMRADVPFPVTAVHHDLMSAEDRIAMLINLSAGV